MARIIFVATVLVALCCISQAQPLSGSEESLDKLRSLKEVLEKKLNEEIDKMDLPKIMKDRLKKELRVQIESIEKEIEKLKQEWNNNTGSKEAQVAGISDIWDEIIKTKNEAIKQVEEIKEKAKKQMAEIIEIMEDMKKQGIEITEEWYQKLVDIQKDMADQIKIIMENMEKEIKEIKEKWRNGWKN